MKSYDQFCVFVAILFILVAIFKQICGWPIWTTMQNLEILAWKLSELWSILCFGDRFIFGGHLNLGQIIFWYFCGGSMNFHTKFRAFNYRAKSGAYSLKTAWVMLN